MEVRADLVGDLDPDWLRDRFAGKLLYTLRSQAEGGAGSALPGERAQHLVSAAAAYDYVDLEGALDLDPAVLSAVAAERRVVSWHGPALDLVELRARFSELSAVSAALYKMVPRAPAHGEELLPLALLKSVGRRDLVAFAGGEIGAWTRYLAPRLGAPVVYVAAGERAAATGQPSARRAIADYGLPALPPIRALSGIAGNPVRGSLSPRLHNALYRALGVPRAYLAFTVEGFGDFWLEVVESGSLEVLGFPLLGLSVTAPCKPSALAVAGASSPLAERVGGANTLVKSGTVWEAETTDPEGVVAALLQQGVPLLGRRVAVIGTGGAGCAAAEGLRLAGAVVALVNRKGSGPDSGPREAGAADGRAREVGGEFASGVPALRAEMGEARAREEHGRLPPSDRGRAAATRLGLPLVALHELRPAAFDILVNATPLGRTAGNALPFEPRAIRPGTVVLDLVYGEAPTALLQAVRECGGIGVDGREVLLEQAAGQFRMMTGLEMPRALARATLGLATEPA